MPPAPSRRSAAFTLVELLVVIAIIGLLVGLLTPALSHARRAAIKAACSTNLRAVGVAVSEYNDRWKERYPLARYIPEPFLSGSDLPGLPVSLREQQDRDHGSYRCPGDDDVHALAGISYTYNTGLAGRTIEDTFFAQRLNFAPSDLPVSFDFDGNRFLLQDDGEITVPAFHLRRNLLFADAHVGEYDDAPDPPAESP